MTQYSPKIFRSESRAEYGIAVSQEEFLLRNRPPADISEEEYISSFVETDGDWIIVNRDHSISKIRNIAKYHDNPAIVRRWIRSSAFKEFANED